MLLFTLICLFLTALLGPTQAATGQWDYTTGPYGPANWGKNFPKMCAGFQQSPIDLTGEVKYDPMLPAIKIIRNRTRSTPLTVENDGHGVKVTLSDGEYTVEIIKGETPFKVAQFHFHWGSNSETGSEHKLHGKAYPLELHIVTYRASMYSTFTEAASSPNGLAVLGFFFEQSETGTAPWTAMSAFVTALASVKTPSTTTTMPNFNLASSFPDVDMTKYYRYVGSLTTPPCTENVIWTVFKGPMTVSASQLSAFRELMYSSTFGGGKITNNYRPVLELNPKYHPYHRTLLTSFNSAHTISMSVANKIALLFLTIISLMLRQSLH